MILLTNALNPSTMKNETKKKSIMIATDTKEKFTWNKELHKDHRTFRVKPSSNIQGPSCEK